MEELKERVKHICGGKDFVYESYCPGCEFDEKEWSEVLDYYATNKVE